MLGWLTDYFKFPTFGHSGAQGCQPGIEFRSHCPHFGTLSKNWLKRKHLMFNDWNWEWQISRRRRQTSVHVRRNSSHRLACTGEATCRPAVECYRRRRTTAGFITSFPVGGWSIAIIVSVCLSVCLSAYLKATCPNFTTFSVSVLCGCRSLVATPLMTRYVRPVLCMTSRFHIMEPMSQTRSSVNAKRPRDALCY